MKNKTCIFFLITLSSTLCCVNDEIQIALAILTKESIKTACFSITEWSKWDISDFKCLSANGIFVVSMHHGDAYLDLKNYYKRIGSVIMWIAKSEDLRFWTREPNLVEYDDLMRSTFSLLFDTPSGKILNQIKENAARFLYDSKVFIAKPIENYTTYDVLEVFIINGDDSHRLLKYGQYVKSIGFNGTTENFYKRRSDFNGSVLLGSKNGPDICFNTLSCLYVEIWELFAQMMNFRTAYSVYWDLYNTAVSLHPIIIDSALQYVLVRNKIETFLDFVGPIFTATYYMYIKDTFEDDYSLYTYSRPFSKKLWLYILIWILGLVSFHAIIQISGKIFRAWEKLKEEDNFMFSPLDALFSQCDMSSNKISMRIIIFFTIFVAMIITNSYSATFLSFTMVKKPKLPFTDFESFINDGTYTLGAIKNTYPYSYIERSTDPQMQVIKEKHLLAPNERPLTLEEGMDRICTDKKFAFISLDFHRAGTCKIIRIPKPVMQTSTAMELGISSPYRAIFNHKFIVFRSSGILQRMKMQLEDGSPKENYAIKSEVDYVTIAPLIYFIFYAYGICLVIMTLEIVVGITICKK